MANEIVPSSTALSIVEQDGTLLVDSRLIADRLGIQHESFIKTIRKHQDKIQQRFGVVRFNIGEISGRGQPEKYALLTENQAQVLMTLSKNTEQVIGCKLDLIDAFDKAKQIIKTVIPAQSQQIQELQLINENLRLQLSLSDRQDNRIALHGLPIALLLEGKSDAIVEVEKPTTEVIDDRFNVRFEGQTLKQMAEYIQSRHGMRFKSGADLKRALIQFGGQDLIAQTPRTVTAEYVPKEFLDEAYRLLTNGDRQKLIGE